MEIIKITFGFSFMALFIVRMFINSIIYNRLRNTNRNIFFLVPLEKGAVTHGFEAMFTFNWSIKKDYLKEVKQKMVLSNWMSIICGSLLVLWVFIVVIEKIKR